MKHIINKMELLQQKLNVDFIGLAIYDNISDEIHWRLAVGASNSRYKKIVIRMGKGIAGEVIQLNRPIKIENYPADVLGKPIEYPIILVEHLKSVLAVPVVENLGTYPYGVVLLGQRSPKSYTNADEEEAIATAKEIAKELNSAEISSKKKASNKIPDLTSLDYINDSFFVKYLAKEQEQIKKQKRGSLDFEVLDQSVVEVPTEIQEILVANTADLLAEMNQKNNDVVKISILRDDGRLIIDCQSNQSIANPKDIFSDIYRRLGKVGGSVASYQGEKSLNFAMQIPVWSYRNPFG